MGHLVPLEDLDDGFGLVRRNHLVLAPLEYGDRVADPVRVEERRPGLVPVAVLGQRPDHQVQVLRLELVGVRGQAEEIGHAVEAQAGPECTGMMDEGVQHGKPARASALDDDAVRVGEFPFDEGARAAHGVLRIVLPPVLAQRGHV